jgi:imidazolonepropionase-like amidohydrolase
VAVLISAGQVLLGRVGERVEDGAVLIEGGRIVAVGPRDEVAARTPADATAISFPDGTVLPGLIDCHVHLAFNGGADAVESLTTLDDADLLLGMAARARQLLDSGVTTARDLGDRGGLSVRLRDAIADGTVPGPRILAATAPLTVPGGHCWFLGGEVEGEQAIRDRVRRNADMGADVIKVMASGGHLTPDGPSMTDAQFDPDDLVAAVDEARRAGLPVAAHAHATEGIAAAVAAGVDTIEHCTWLTDSGFDTPPELVAEIIERKISVCPAMSRNWRGFARRFGPEIAEALIGRLRWLDEQGIRLVAGTDAGIPGAGFDGYVDGLGAFAHVGISNAKIIEIATANAAAAIGLAGTAGLVASGFDADLVVVDGDPVADLDALRDVRLVLSRGRPHIPAAATFRAAAPMRTAAAEV